MAVLCSIFRQAQAGLETCNRSRATVLGLAHQGSFKAEAVTGGPAQHQVKGAHGLAAAPCSSGFVGNILAVGRQQAVEIKQAHAALAKAGQVAHVRTQIIWQCVWRRLQGALGLVA